MQDETISALQAGEEPPGAVNKAPEEAANRLSQEELQERLRAIQAGEAPAGLPQPATDGAAAPAAEPPVAPQ